MSIYHLLIGVNTERKKRSESAAKDRLSGSSCHGHCKCPFTVHLTQDCSQQVGVSPRPRGHSQLLSFVITLSFYLSVSEPHAQILAWSAVTSSAFLSTRLRPVKDPHEEGPDRTHSSPEYPCLQIWPPSGRASIHLWETETDRSVNNCHVLNGSNILFWHSIKCW